MTAHLARVPTRSDEATSAADAVAELLETVAAADERIAAAVDDLGTRPAVTPATVAGLEGLLPVLRCAVQARTELLGLDPALLLSGMELWRERRAAAEHHCRPSLGAVR